MALIDYTLDILTDGSGDETEIGASAVNGLLYAIEWVVGTLATGVDAVISITQPSGVVVTLLTLTDADANAMYYLRLADSDNTGSAGSGTVLPLFIGVPKCVVTDGGATKTGKVVFYYTKL